MSLPIYSNWIQLLLLFLISIYTFNITWAHSSFIILALLSIFHSNVEGLTALISRHSWINLQSPVRLNSTQTRPSDYPPEQHIQLCPVVTTLSDTLIRNCYHSSLVVKTRHRFCRATVLPQPRLSRQNQRCSKMILLAILHPALFYVAQHHLLLP